MNIRRVKQGAKITFYNGIYMILFGIFYAIFIRFNMKQKLSLLTEQRGLDFAARKITVSTCGLVPQMLELGTATKVNLAVYVIFYIQEFDASIQHHRTQAATFYTI